MRKRNQQVEQIIPNSIIDQQQFFKQNKSYVFICEILHLNDWSWWKLKFDIDME